MAEVTPIKRIRTSNGDAQIHFHALTDDTGLQINSEISSFEEYIKSIVPSSGGEGGESADLSKYSTTEEMNTAILHTKEELMEYTNDKIANIDFSDYYSKSEVDTFFKKQYYYADPYIIIPDRICGASPLDTGEKYADINVHLAINGVLVIPYNIYETYWNPNDSYAWNDPIFNIEGDRSTITKIIIPRGMKFRHPLEIEDMGDEKLVELFPNLETIVRIHEDGAVLSYNIKTGSLN